MSDTTNKPSLNSIVPAATSGEAMALGSLLLGWLILQASNPVGFLLGNDHPEFGKAFASLFIVALLSTVLAVLALTKSAVGWVRAAAGGGIFLSVLGVIFAILGKLFA